MTTNHNYRYLVSPFFDFVLLGGGSLVLVPLMLYLYPVERIHARQLNGVFFLMTMLFSYLANASHFIYSYQILYKDFIKKLAGTIDKPLQWPYWWASVVVPVILVMVIGYGYLGKNIVLLGFLANLGLLFNGWHFAKQGFGVLVVTSVYQKVFYTAWERRVLIWNANIAWVYLWIFINTGLHQLEFWHLKACAIVFPPIIERVFFYMLCLGAAAVTFIFVNKHARDRRFPPFNGIVAYGTSIYFWPLLLSAPWLTKYHPIIWLIPSLHAIQYNTVVFRMKQNEMKRHVIDKNALFFFILAGVVLGLIMFKPQAMLPMPVNNNYSELYTYTFAAIFVAVFISIHHFFIDNVIWRKEHGDVKNYLFDVS